MTTKRPSDLWKTFLSDLWLASAGVNFTAGGGGLVLVSSITLHVPLYFVNPSKTVKLGQSWGVNLLEELG